MTVKKIAGICHEANRAYCQTLDDHSQPPWLLAEGWQVKSAINGVRHHLDNPDSTPADSHNSWLAEKEADGWKYGEIKDPEAKTHPCMVPFEELPPEQQAKDRLFMAIVKALAPLVSGDES